MDEAKPWFFFVFLLVPHVCLCSAFLHACLSTLSRMDRFASVAQCPHLTQFVHCAKLQKLQSTGMDRFAFAGADVPYGGTLV